jgi:hypothetical protein
MKVVGRSSVILAGSRLSVFELKKFLVLGSMMRKERSARWVCLALMNLTPWSTQRAALALTRH